MSGAAGCSGGATHRFAERLSDHLARALGQAIVHHRVRRAASEEHRHLVSAHACSHRKCKAREAHAHRAVGGVHAAVRVITR